MLLRMSLTLILLAGALPAGGAVSSRIQTSGSIATSPFQFHALPSNTKDGSADPMNLGGAGDDAVAAATLMGTAGFLTLSSHGCSGPALGGPGGTANANSYVDYVEVFVIQSDTLPLGTPVTINVKLAAARSFRANVIQPFPVRLGDAAVNAEASVVFNTDISVVSFRGDFAAQQVHNEPINRGMSGIFASSSGPPEDAGEPKAGEFIATLPGRVGGEFKINLATHIGAGSSASNPVVGDGDGQMSLMWGADVVGGLAVILNSGGDPLPPPSYATVVGVLAILPPPPDEIVPEPTSAVLLLVGAGLVMARRVRK